MPVLLSAAAVVSSVDADVVVGCYSNSDGLTPVLIAAAYGHCDALRLLLEAGGDACQTDLEGNDALRYAQESGCQQCCTLVSQYSGLSVFIVSDLSVPPENNVYETSVGR